MLRAGMPLPRSEAQPSHRLDIAAASNATAPCVHHAEAALRISMSLEGGVAIPLHCFGVVQWHAGAVGVHRRKVVLGFRKTLDGGFAIPPRCFSAILSHTLAFQVSEREVVLG